MKIALLVPGGVDRSGTRRVIPFLLWVIERLVGAGHEVHVFAHRQEPEPGTWPLLGATVHNAGRQPRRLRMLQDLRREHARGAFHVLHAFWAIPSGEVAAPARALLRVPVVLWLPGGDLVALPEIGYGVRLRRRGRIQLRYAIAGADRVLVPSRYSLGQARTLGIDAAQLPFGVALDHWPIAPPRPRPPERVARLLHVASLNAVKDQDTLLLAAASLQRRAIPFRLDIIGEDTLHGRVQRQAAAHGLGDVVAFQGFLEQRELRGRVLESDLLLLSSRHETGPLVIHEAAASGVPTVGTAVGELAEWAPEAALTVPVDDAEGLADATALLIRDDARRLALAARAQARVIAWNVDHTVSAMLALSEELRHARSR
jgi:glycosyltransferase involved in cell wall biosynthesis